SVSIVMMKGVSDMARGGRDHSSRGRTAQDLLEGLEVGRQDLLVAVLAVDVRSAAVARRLPLCRIGEEANYRSGDFGRRLCCDAQALALYHPVRVGERDHRNAAYPSLQVGIRKPLDV